MLMLAVMLLVAWYHFMLSPLVGGSRILFSVQFIEEPYSIAFHSDHMSGHESSGKSAQGTYSMPLSGSGNRDTTVIFGFSQNANYFIDSCLLCFN